MNFSLCDTRTRLNLYKLKFYSNEVNFALHVHVDRVELSYVPNQSILYILGYLILSSFLCRIVAPYFRRQLFENYISVFLYELNVCNEVPFCVPLQFDSE